jgi:uncharacterized protein YjbJ (UPF0337 family)
MTKTHKAKHAVEKAAGKVEEQLGKHINNEELQEQVKTDKTKGSLKNASENAKDAFDK